RLVSAALSPPASWRIPSLRRRRHSPQTALCRDAP
ncbi:hypothetical protein PBMFNG_PBMFNG_11955, partial [Dysosmobacter welbionis]